MTLTLYHAPYARSSSILWLLEELGAPYDLEVVTIQRRDRSVSTPKAPVYRGARDPRNPHPHGKVPALLHDGVVIYESTAIALYLGDLFAEANLTPAIDDRRRGSYVALLAYYSAVLEPAITVQLADYPPPDCAIGWVSLPAALEHLEAILTANPYLLGTRVTVADIVYGGGLGYLHDTGMIAATPRIIAYLEALRTRSAYRCARVRDEELAARAGLGS